MLRRFAFCLLPALIAASAQVAVADPAAPSINAAIAPVLIPEARAPEVEPSEAPRPEPGRRSRGRIAHRILHFTFDDGPRLDTTPELLDHLDRHGVRATFFVVARGLVGTHAAAEARRALLRDIVSRGHHIGMHTYSHPRLTELSDEEVTAELVRAETTVAPLLAERPWLFRPPFGARDSRIDALVAEAGYTQMLWNITSNDISGRSAEDIVDAFRNNLNRRQRRRDPGGVVLLHDTKQRVVDAFPAMMAELANRNCELLEDSEAELWDVAGDPAIFHQRGPATRAARVVELPEAQVAERQRELRALWESRCGE